MDVATAFLNSELSEEIYIEIPELFELLYCNNNLDRKCLKLNKSLYRLKQAPRVWFLVVCQFFDQLGLYPSKADPNLFLRIGVFLMLFVNDMLIISNRGDVNSTKRSINNKWVCEDLGEAKIFVGFQIERNRAQRTIKIHQSIYARKLVERYGLKGDSNSITIPLPPGTILKKKDELPVLPQKSSLPATELRDLDRDKHLVYRQITGHLNYLANRTRLDYSYIANQLSRHLANPLVYHLRYTKTSLRYLSGTLEYSITYLANSSPPPLFKSPNNLYTLFSDTTWGSEGDRKLCQGWVAIRAGRAILWSAIRQKSTSQLSIEAKFIAANKASKEAAWLEKLILDLAKNNTKEPPTLFIDNSPAIDLIHNHKFHSKAKHIDIRVNYIRNDMVGEGRLVARHIPGEQQPADLLTKQLSHYRLRQLLVTIGVLEAGRHTQMR